VRPVRPLPRGTARGGWDAARERGVVSVEAAAGKPNQGGHVSPVNPHPEVLFYSRIRRSPYYYASREHNVKMYSTYNHMYHARHYGDPVEEYWQLINGVTLWDVGVERQIEISGPDAFEFTNLL